MILEDKLLVLTPVQSSKTAQWACASNLPSELMPKVCTFDDSVGGIADGTAWASLSDEDKATNTACWSPSMAGEVGGGGTGWMW